MRTQCHSTAKLVHRFAGLKTNKMPVAVQKMASDGGEAVLRVLSSGCDSAHIIHTLIVMLESFTTVTIYGVLLCGHTPSIERS